MSDNEGEEAGQVLLPPSRKAVRRAAPDLTVIVGEGVDQRSFQFHSLMLETRSSFFESLVSSGMQESLDRKVTLSDVDPDTFEAAMKYLDDPAAASEMTPIQAVQVGPFYHKYGFETGLKLFESVFGRYIKAINDRIDRRLAILEDHELTLYCQRDYNIYMQY